MLEVLFTSTENHRLKDWSLNLRINNSSSKWRSLKIKKTILSTQGEKSQRQFTEVGSSYLLLCPVVESWDTARFWSWRSSAPLPQTHSTPRSRIPDLFLQQPPTQQITQLFLQNLNTGGFPVYHNIFLDIAYSVVKNKNINTVRN